jgi:hypothetical protein
MAWMGWLKTRNVVSEMGFMQPVWHLATKATLAFGGMKEAHTVQRVTSEG